MKIVKSGDIASGGGTGGANDQPEPFGNRKSNDESNDEHDNQSNYDKFIGRSSHGSQASNNVRNELQNYEQATLQSILAQTQFNF